MKCKKLRISLFLLSAIMLFSCKNKKKDNYYISTDNLHSIEIFRKHIYESNNKRYLSKERTFIDVNVNRLLNEGLLSSLSNFTSLPMEKTSFSFNEDNYNDVYTVNFIKDNKTDYQMIFVAPYGPTRINNLLDDWSLSFDFESCNETWLNLLKEHVIEDFIKKIGDDIEKEITEI